MFEFSFGVRAGALDKCKRGKMEINHRQFAAVAPWKCQCLISVSGLGKMEIDHWQFTAVALGTANV